MLYMFKKKKKKLDGGGGGVWCVAIRVFLGFLDFFYLDKTPNCVTVFFNIDFQRFKSGFTLDKKI